MLQKYFEFVCENKTLFYGMSMSDTQYDEIEIDDYSTTFKIIEICSGDKKHEYMDRLNLTLYYDVYSVKQKLGFPRFSAHSNK